jgi:hypothetical protein
MTERSIPAGDVPSIPALRRQWLEPLSLFLQMEFLQTGSLQTGLLLQSRRLLSEQGEIAPAGLAGATLGESSFSGQGPW